MTNHLKNVCIMQKYNDSEKVLELREEFNESEAFIKKAVNCHDELVIALAACINIFEGINKSDVKLTILQIETLKDTLKKASE